NLPLDKEGLSAELDEELLVERSGWVALRASGPGRPDSPLPALYAHTSPIYVEVAGAPPRSREDARFFLAWIDDLAVMLRARGRIPTEELRAQVESQLNAARAVYARIAKGNEGLVPGGRSKELGRR